MYVYLRPSPSTTTFWAGSIDDHGRSWTVIRNTEKQKVGAAPRGPVGPGVSGGLDLGGPPAAHRVSGTGADVGSALGDADRANAVANNEPGRARTTLERPCRRVACQRAVWTTTAGSGRTW